MSKVLMNSDTKAASTKPALVYAKSSVYIMARSLVLFVVFLNECMSGSLILVPLFGSFPSACLFQLQIDHFCFIFLYFVLANFQNE